jgi:hypothetical protein
MRRGVPEVEVYMKNGKRYLRESYGAFDIVTELTPKDTPKEDKPRIETKDPDETFDILNEAISSLVKEERKKQKKDGKKRNVMYF